MVGGEIVSVFLVVAVLFGRITEWEHFPHYGGGNGIITSGDVVLAATSGGILFSHYSTEENNLVPDSGWTSPGKLSYDHVSHVTFDDSGNLWVSLSGGGIDVFLPDGSRTSFNQIDGLPLNLGINQTMPDSFVYVATTQGLCIREVGFFETFNSLSTGGGLPSDNITCLSASDSGLYVGTTAGLVFLPRSANPQQESSWVLQSIDAASVATMEWQNDTLWVATAAGLYLMAPGQPWTRDELFPSGNISSLAWGSGGMAAGCTNQCFILNDGEWHQYSSNLAGNALTGLVWKGSRLYGVLASTYADNRLSGAGMALLLENGSWRRNLPDFGPVSNDLRDCTILPDGSVWVAGNRGGVSVLAEQQWQPLGRYMTDLNQNFAICPSGEGVFVSSIGHGVDWLSWQNGTIENTIHLTDNDGLLNNMVFCAEQGDATTVWFGHRTLEETQTSGVCRLKWAPGDSSSISFTSITGVDGLPSKEVNAVLPEGDRYCWAGTDGGLARIDAYMQTVRETYTAQDGLPSSLVTSLARDRSGTVYIGTASGLAYLNNGTVTEVEQIGVGVIALECDGLGSVWISTGEGLKRYFRASGVLEEYTAFNSPLAEGTIYNITADTNRGNLWLATNYGFWRGTLCDGLSGNGSHSVVYPDPFIPDRGDILGVAGIPDTAAEVSIFDVAGNLVYRFSAAGRENIAWDGLNTRGQPAASGVYFLQLEQAGSVLGLLKFALVR